MTTGTVDYWWIDKTSRATRSRIVEGINIAVLKGMGTFACLTTIHAYQLLEPLGMWNKNALSSNSDSIDVSTPLKLDCARRRKLKVVWMVKVHYKHVEIHSQLLVKLTARCSLEYPSLSLPHLGCKNLESPSPSIPAAGMLTEPLLLTQHWYETHFMMVIEVASQWLQFRACVSQHSLNSIRWNSRTQSKGDLNIRLYCQIWIDQVIARIIEK